MSMGRTMEAIVWAMNARGISAGAYKVLMKLSKRVGIHNFRVWPSHKKLAEDCELSVSTVRRHLAELEERGYLKIVPRYDDAGDRTSNEYLLQVRVRITTPHDVDEIEPEYQADEDHDAGADVSSSAEGGLFKLNRPSVQFEGTGLFTGEQAEDIPDGTNSSGRLPPSPDGDGTPQTQFELVAEQIEPEPLVAYVEHRWHELASNHAGIADVRKIDDGLAKMIRDRAGNHARGGEGAQAVWGQVFDAIERSPFLQGRAPPGRDHSKPFRLSLGWLSKPANFREVIGGRYDGHDDPNRIDPATGRRLGPTEQAVRGTITRLRAARERSAGYGGGGTAGRRIAGP